MCHAFLHRIWGGGGRLTKGRSDTGRGWWPGKGQKLLCSAAQLSKELIRCSERTLKLLIPVQHLCSKNRSMQ